MDADMQERPEPSGTQCLRIAAAGDVHCSEARREEIRRSVAALNGVADLVLFAGDLTTHGEPEQGAVLAEACAAYAERLDRQVAGEPAENINELRKQWQDAKAKWAETAR